MILSIDAMSATIGGFTISGTASKTSDVTVSLPEGFGTSEKVDTDHFHLKTVGKVIENNESLLRNDVVEGYISK